MELDAVPGGDALLIILVILGRIVPNTLNLIRLADFVTGLGRLSDGAGDPFGGVDDEFRFGAGRKNEPGKYQENPTPPGPCLLHVKSRFAMVPAIINIWYRRQWQSTLSGGPEGNPPVGPRLGLVSPAIPSEHRRQPPPVPWSRSRRPMVGYPSAGSRAFS